MSVYNRVRNQKKGIKNMTSKTFIKVPTQLFTDEYSNMTCDAKILYGHICARMKLSKLNGFCDEQGRVYVIFTISEIRKIINCSNNKAIKTLAELEVADLIERKKRGQGKADLVFLKEESKELENQSSRSAKKGFQEVKKVERNKNNINKNDLNKKDSILLSKEEGVEEAEPVKKRRAYESELKESISYDAIISDGYISKYWLDEKIELMLDVMSSTGRYVRINSENVPIELVRERYLTLNKSNIEYLHEAVRRMETPPNSLRSFYITALYNSPTVSESSWEKWVKEDLSSL